MSTTSIRHHTLSFVLGFCVLSGAQQAQARPLAASGASIHSRSARTTPRLTPFGMAKDFGRALVQFPSAFGKRKALTERLMDQYSPANRAYEVAYSRAYHSIAPACAFATVSTGTMLNLAIGVSPLVAPVVGIYEAMFFGPVTYKFNREGKGRFAAYKATLRGEDKKALALIQNNPGAFAFFKHKANMQFVGARAAVAFSRGAVRVANFTHVGHAKAERWLSASRRALKENLGTFNAIRRAGL